MSEHEIMWIGRQPAQPGPATLPAEDPAFEAAVRRICEAAGCPVDRFVAARGEFGSWLVELRRNEQVQRLIWNGRTGRLSLDVPNRAGGWDESSAEALGQAELATLEPAMARLLGSGPQRD